MEIKNLSDLTKLFELCRKKGVELYDFNGLIVKFREELPRRRKSKTDIQEINEDPQFTQEDFLNWSAPSVE